MLKYTGLIGLFCWMMSGFLIADPVRKIAITIDDLPFVSANHVRPGDIRRSNERFLKIIETFEAYHIPVTGFVIGGAIAKDQWPLLERFHNDGFIIGNHTYSHPSLDHVSAENYIAEIARTDKIITPLMTGPRYFRYPYLAEGKGEKKQKVSSYLNSTHYVVAPITIDSKDFAFNARLLAINWRNRMQALPGIKRRYLDYIAQQTQKAEARIGSKPSVQILLIHSNLLNSEALGDVLAMYQNRGYQFISLQEALNSLAPVTSASAVPAPVASALAPVVKP